MLPNIACKITVKQKNKGPQGIGKQWDVHQYSGWGTRGTNGRGYRKLMNVKITAKTFEQF